MTPATLMKCPNPVCPEMLAVDFPPDTSEKGESLRARVTCAACKKPVVVTRWLRPRLADILHTGDHSS